MAVPSGPLGPQPSDVLNVYSRALPADEYEVLRLWTDQFYPYQRDWLLEPADFAACNKSRQIGYSFSSAGIGVLWGAFSGEMTTVVSKGDLESVEVLDKAKRHIAVLQALGSKMCDTLKSNTNEIVFASGGRILALPSSAGRGFTGNVILDEFGHQQHATQVWDAAAMVAMLGFKIRVISTPNGIGNEFYDLVQLAVDPERRRNLPPEAGNLPWIYHCTDIHKAKAQGYPVNLARCWNLAKGDPRIFAQNFECSFLDSVLQYIPGSMIEDCEVGADEPVGDPHEGIHYAGLDIGRTANLTVLLILRVIGNQRRVVAINVMKRTDTSEQLHDLVDRAFAEWKIKRLCIDVTGIGKYPGGDIKKKHSERIDVPHRRPRVELVDFTLTNKDAMATGLFASMMNMQMELPMNDGDLPVSQVFDGSSWRDESGAPLRLRREIASIQRVITPAAGVRYETPNTAEGHADRAWALMLANHACQAPNAMVEAVRLRALGGAANMNNRRERKKRKVDS